ncbi:MAG: FHA domain-containing protein [Myxococcaceae bacterium]|nr:MAG: FHA domain-containing protein [Myxococcaceae bacterium]
MRFCRALPEGRRFSLERPMVSVGSDPACDVVVSAPGVKNSHALLFRDARGWTVSPLDPGCDLRIRGRRVDLGGGKRCHQPCLSDAECPGGAPRACAVLAGSSLRACRPP